MTSQFAASKNKISQPCKNTRRLSWLASSALTAASLVALSSNPAQADPPPWSQFLDEHGQITIDLNDPMWTHILQHSNIYVGISQYLNIPEGYTVNIIQPNSGSIFAAKAAHDSDPTQILGALQANGRVIIMDRNGVFFGQGSRVDVAGMIATTGEISTDQIVKNDFGAYTIDNIGADKDARIEMHGVINIADAGLAAFVAPTVINSGIINARYGKVGFASGERVTIDPYGDNLFEIEVPGHIAALLENTETGQINAEGGLVQMSAATAENIVDNLINVDGIVTVGSASVQGGKIVLSGEGKNSRVRVGGKLDASGTNGGTIDVRGEMVEIAEGASLTADSTSSDGAAGTIRAIAGNTLTVNGALSARGRTGTGFIDTSAAVVNFNDKASILTTGEWLLDPTNIIIDAVLEGIIESQLTTGNVTITTPSGGGQQGNITVLRTIDWSSAFTLTLNAIGDIIFDAVNAGLNATGLGNAILNAGDDIRILNGTGIRTNGGFVTFDANDEFQVGSGQTVRTNGGTINVNADAFILDGFLNAGSGLINITRDNDPGSSDDETNIDVGDDNGSNFRISQSELNRMTAGTLSIGSATGAGNQINIDNADFRRFAQSIINTRRDDSSVEQDVLFRGTNYFNALTVNADDDIVFGNNATLDAYGNVVFNTDTNVLGVGGFSMGSNSRLSTHGFNLTVNTLGVNLGTGALVDAAGGNIDFNNSGIFHSNSANSVRTTGTGTVEINQHQGGSIQNAIDAIQNTGTGQNTIFVSAGTYTENLTINQANLKLDGNNATLRAATPGQALITVLESNFNLDPFVLDGLGIVNYGIYASGIGAVGLISDGNTFRNFVDAGIYVANNLGGVTTILNNIFEGSSTRGVVTGNWSGGSVLNITGNTFGSNVARLLNAVQVGNVTNASVNISGGSARTTGDAITFASLTGASVDINGVNVNSNGGHGVAFLGNISGGTTTVRNSTIVASNATKDGVNFGSGQSLNNGAVVNITGNDITGGDDAVNMMRNMSGNAQVNVNYNTRLRGVTGDGVYIWDTGSQGGATVQVIGNTDVTAGDDGIELNNLRSANVSGNHVHDTGDDGIVAINNDFTSIFGNVLNRIGNNGIFVEFGDSVGISNNTIDTTGNDAIHVYDNDGVHIMGNGITRAGRDGVHVVNSDDIWVISNTIFGQNGGFFTNGANGANRYGIYVYGGDNAFIFANTIRGGNGGFFGSGGDGAGVDGIHVENSSQAVISSNNILGGNGSIFGWGGNGANRHGIFAANSGGFGWGGNGIVVTDNVIDGGLFSYGAGSDGIHVENSAGGFFGNAALIAGNYVNGVGNDGIFVTGTNGVRILGNTVMFTGGDGIDMENSSFGLIEDNYVFGTDDSGIEVSNSFGAHVLENFVRLTGGNGIDVRNSDLSVIAGNVVAQTGWNGIFVSGSDLATIAGNIVTLTANYGIQLVGGIYNTIAGNWVSFTGNDGIRGENTDFLNVLFNLVTFTGGDGISLWNADFADVVGNVVSFADDDGIDVENSFGVDVIGNWVSFVAHNGIELSNSAFADVVGNVVTFAGDNGIDVENGFGTDIYGNFIRFVGHDGIAVRNSDFVDVNFNNIAFAGDDGVDIRHSFGADVYGNLISFVGGDGVSAYNSEFIDIIGNIMAFIGDDGVDVRNSDFADINHNWISHTGGDSIQVRNSDFVDVIGNVLRNAGDDGIDIENSNNIEVIGNDIDDTNNNGIEVENANGVYINGNTVRHAGLAGIFVDPSFNVTISNNLLEDNDTGIRLVSVNGAVVENNTINNSLTTGIEINDSDAVQILFNTITGSGQYGLHAAGGTNGSIVLRGNTFTDNTVGAFFESGTVDISDLANPNTFTGGDVALRFSPFIAGTPLSLVGNTLGGTIFSGQSTYYVELLNGAFFLPGTPTIIDGRFASFDGIVPNSAFPLDAFGNPIIPADILALIESKLFDFDDLGSIGQIFVGNALSIENFEDFFRQFSQFSGGTGGLNVTITGLPRTGQFGTAVIPGGAGAFNALAPQAGDEEDNRRRRGTAQNVAAIEPAAGEEGGAVGATQAAADDLAEVEPAAGQDTACWTQAVNAASAGAAVNYSYGGSFEESLSDAVNCGAAF